MNIIDLHPEQALDHAAREGLAAESAEDLRRHLRDCAACAATERLRADFAQALAEPVDAEAIERLTMRMFGSALPLPIPVTPPRRWARRALRVAAGLALCTVASGIAGAALGRYQPSWLSALPYIDRILPTAQPQRRRAPRAPRPSASVVVPPVATATVASATPVAPILKAPLVPQAPARPRPDVATIEERPPASTAPPPLRSVADPPPPALPAPPPPELVSAPAPSSPRTLFAAFVAARDAGRIEQAGAGYAALIARAPESHEALTASVLLGQALIARGAAADGRSLMNRYLGATPDGPLAEEARVGRALAAKKLGDRNGERAAWDDLLLHHPRSVHARIAASRLQDLR